MRKIAVQIESKNGMKACHVSLPSKFADDPMNETLIRDELTKAFDSMGFSVMSVQRIKESGIEMRRGPQRLALAIAA